MKNDGIPKTASRIHPLIHAVTVLLIILALTSGCHSEKPAPSPAALALKTHIHAKLDLFSPSLSENIQKKNRAGINLALDNFYAELNGQGDTSHFFLALLDSHGVTIASRAKSAVNGIQNYGNYRVVSKVLQKKAVFLSSLYLQGGRKVYIICAPLLCSGKLMGVLIIGIDSDYLRHSDISEREFMSQNYNTSNNGIR